MAALVLTALSISPVLKDADQSKCAVSVSSNYQIHCTIDRKPTTTCERNIFAIQHIRRFFPDSVFRAMITLIFCVIPFTISVFVFSIFSGRCVS